MPELDTLLPDEEITLSDGTKVSVQPFRFGQFPKVIRLISGIADRLTGTDEIDPLEIALALVEDDGVAVLELMALSSNQPLTWCEALPGDDGIALLGKVVEVNLDFFSRRVTPAIVQLSASLAKLSDPAGAPADGPTSSPDSSKQGTPGAISKPTPQAK